MRSIDQVGITFVNMLVGRGVLNGVINLQFSSLLFSPSDDGMKIESDPVVSCRLRLDIPCARHVHQALGELLASIDTPPESITVTASNGADNDEEMVKKAMN